MDSFATERMPGGSLTQLEQTAMAAAATHVDQVYAVADGHAAPCGLERVSSSWTRCVKDYRVDPANDAAPRILTLAELEWSRGPIESLIASARDELDALYKLVRPAGYVLLLSDRTGTVVDHRGDQSLAHKFKHWGVWLGGVWSEAVEGTNGIGTTIVDERPVSVHTSEHFRARHIGLSCVGAPICDVDGTLVAVLDLSSCDPNLAKGTHALAGTLTVAAARAIEERLFRERFRRDWIVAVAFPKENGPSALLAVDAWHRVVAANNAARRNLAIDDAALRGGGLCFWKLFGRDDSLFSRNDGRDKATRLEKLDGTEQYPALLTPPEAAHGASNLALHARARSDLLGTVRDFVRTRQTRGGLAPSTMRRVRDYVDAHLGESIGLCDLAEEVGLSVHHFARAFKQTSGVTPHYYLIQKRVERAQRLLADPESSLSEIALAVGFADQSHLTRRFREILGVTPNEFRHSR